MDLSLLKNPSILTVACILGAFLLLLLLICVVLLTRKKPVPNVSFRMPESDARRRAADSLLEEDAETARGEILRRARRRRRLRAVAVTAAVLLAAVAAVITLALTDNLPAPLANSIGTVLGRPVEAEPGELSLSSQLLYAQNDVTVTAESITRTDYGWSISLLLDNHSALNLSFNADSFAVNGIMMETSLFDQDCSVPAGQKATVELTLNSSVLRSCDMDSIRCVDLILQACNSDTHLRVFDTDQLEICTSLYDGRHDELGGNAVWLSGNITVFLLSSTETDCTFCIANHTGDSVRFSIEDMMFNGCSTGTTDYSLQNIMLLDNCARQITVTADAAFLRSIGTSALATLQWRLIIDPADTTRNTWSGTITCGTGADPGTAPTPVPVWNVPDENGSYAVSGVGPFTDVDPRSYYADSVLWAYESYISRGTSETTFSPEEGCSRGQVITFLWRAESYPDAAYTESPFLDVAEGDGCYEAVLWGAGAGIIAGTSSDTFSPDIFINRAQLVTILWRLAGYPEVNLEETWNPFLDVSENDTYLTAVLWAYEAGIVSGTDERSFSPNAVVTRGAAVTFLHRYYNYMLGY